MTWAWRKELIVPKVIYWLRGMGAKHETLDIWLFFEYVPSSTVPEYLMNTDLEGPEKAGIKNWKKKIQILKKIHFNERLLKQQYEMNEETNSLLGAKYRNSILREAKLTAMSHLYLQKPSIILQCKNRGFPKIVTPISSPRCTASRSHVSPFIVCEGHPACRQFN